MHSKGNHPTNRNIIGNTMSNSEAIHESRTSDKVVKFINHSDLNKKAQKAINNGEVVGFYYTPKGNIRFHDIWNETHPAQ